MVERIIACIIDINMCEYLVIYGAVDFNFGVRLVAMNCVAPMRMLVMECKLFLVAVDTNRSTHNSTDVCRKNTHNWYQKSGIS